LPRRRRCPPPAEPATCPRVCCLARGMRRLPRWRSGARRDAARPDAARRAWCIMSDSAPVPLDPVLAAIRERTPARILVRRAGESYDTGTLLALRADHAAARDAVDAELQPAFAASVHLRLLNTLALTKTEHLLRPNLGRRLSDETRQLLASSYPKESDLQ